MKQLVKVIRFRNTETFVLVWKTMINFCEFIFSIFLKYNQC